MKKAIFTFVFIIATALCANAQTDGFFRTGDSDYRNTPGVDEPTVPHGTVGGIKDQDAAPLGSGLLVLTALGAGYALKRREKSSDC